MPRVHHVKKARKDYTEAGITKGSSYYWWKFNYGPKIKSRTRPKPAQLTQSEFLSWYYDIQEQIDEFNDRDNIEDDIQTIVDQIEEMASELQDRLDNMPEGLRDTSSSGELLQERIDGLEGWMSALGDVDCSCLEDIEGGLDSIGIEPEDHENASSEQIEEGLEANFDEVLDEIKDADPGIS